MSYFCKVTGTDGTTGLIGSSLFGTCATEAATVAKVGTCSDFDTLITGVTIHIKFTNSNTASNPTLNVNNTGAKRIYKNGTTSPGTTAATSWKAGEVVSLTYDGSAWQMNDTYTHPAYTSASSGLYKITVDSTGHVSGTASVAKGDIPTLDYVPLSGGTMNGGSTIVIPNADNSRSSTLTCNGAQLNVSTTSTWAMGLSYYNSGSTSTSVGFIGAYGTTDAFESIRFGAGWADNRWWMKIDATDGLTVTKSIYLNSKSANLYIQDSTSTKFALTGYNGSNLWIGAAASNYYHHKGGTYISTGWSGTLPTTAGSSLTGNSSVYISIPTYTVDGNGTGSWSHNTSEVLHGRNYTSYTYSATTSRTKNTVLAAPNGSNGAATFRALVAADIPSLDYSKVSITRNLTTGTKVGTITIDGTPTDLYCQTNTNTDTLVSQTFASADHNRPLLMSYYDTGVETTTAQVVHRNDTLYFNPSSGILRSPRLYLQTTGMPITINLDTLKPTAGENVNVLSVRYKNTDGTATHTVCPIGIFGNDATGSSATVNSGVRLGSTNGTTIVGAGESSTTLAAAQAKYNDENLYFVADGAVYMYTSCNNDSTTVTGPWRVGGFTTGTSAITSGRVMITDGTTGGFKASDYTIAKSVPSDAKFSDTTYSAGTGLSLSGTTINHSNSVTEVTNYNKPYVKYDAQGHITGSSYWSATASGTGGKTGWIKIATIVHTKTYDNTPIMLFISQRGDSTHYRIHIVWANANNTDPDLGKFYLVSDESTSAEAYIIKSATSTWDLYIKKLDAYEAVTMHLYVGKYFTDHMTWTWQDVQTAASAITGGTAATKMNYYDTKISRTANTVLAAPNGSNGVATFRKLVADDIPNLSGSYLPLSGGTLTGELTFASFANATADADRHIFFKHNTANRICTNDDFKYNPAKKKLYCTVVNRKLTGGTAVAGQDKGSGVSPRYFPAQWKFNAGLTPADGDTIIIKLPGAGHASGVWLSVNNGTTYYPISNNNKTRLQTQFASGQYIELMFKSDGKTTTYPIAGADTTSDLPSSGGCWVVLNYYDSNSDTKVRQTLTSGNSNRPILLSYAETSSSTANVDNVAYRNNSIYANPSAGTITANKFYGDITGSGLNAGIYDLLNTDDPIFNGTEWMLTSIPSSSGGTSTPSFRRVKTAKFADYVTSNSRDVLFNDSTNTSKSITLSNPPTDTQYLKLYFKSSGNMGQSTMDNSVYSIAEVPYMTDVNLGGILQVAQPSDNMGVLKSTVLAFTIKITNNTLTLTKASYPSRLDGSAVSNDTHLSANIIKVVAYR